MPCHRGVPVFSEASEPADTLELTQTAADLPYSEAPSAQPGLNVEELLFALWLIGECMLLLWFAAVNIRLWRKLRHSRRMVSIENFPLKVYITDEAETPCLFGLLRPAVYLTLETPLEGPALRHVLEHELAHRAAGRPYLGRCCAGCAWFCTGIIPSSGGRRRSPRGTRSWPVMKRPFAGWARVSARTMGARCWA